MAKKQYEKSATVPTLRRILESMPAKADEKSRSYQFPVSPEWFQERDHIVIEPKAQTYD